MPFATADMDETDVVPHVVCYAMDSVWKVPVGSWALLRAVSGWEAIETRLL